MIIDLTGTKGVEIQRLIQHARIGYAKPRAWGQRGQRWRPVAVRAIWERMRIDGGPWGVWELKQGAVSGPKVRGNGSDGADIVVVAILRGVESDIPEVDEWLAQMCPADAEATA